MRREAAAEAPLDGRDGLRKIDDPLWRFHRRHPVPGRLDVPQPSPCAVCDGMIAGAEGHFRLATIVVGVEMRPSLGLATADPCGVAGTRQ